MGGKWRGWTKVGQALIEIWTDGPPRFLGGKGQSTAVIKAVILSRLARAVSELRPATVFLQQAGQRQPDQVLPAAHSARQHQRGLQVSLLREQILHRETSQREAGAQTDPGPNQNYPFFTRRKVV